MNTDETNQKYSPILGFYKDEDLKLMDKDFEKTQVISDEVMQPDTALPYDIRLVTLFHPAHGELYHLELRCGDELIRSSATNIKEEAQAAITDWTNAVKNPITYEDLN